MAIKGYITKYLSFYNILCLLSATLFLVALQNCNSYFVVYVFVVFLSVVARFVEVCKFSETEISKKEFVVSIIFSFLLSFLIGIANYSTFVNGWKFNEVFSVLGVIFLILLGVIIWFNILVFCNKWSKKFSDKQRHKNKQSWLIFFGMWLCLALFYSLICVLAVFPGNILIDGINQLYQISTGQFSNHHSVFHTLIIDIFWTFGNLIFQNPNAAIFTFFEFQILLFTFSIAYMLYTLWQFNINKIVIVIGLLWFIFMPIFIWYSFTLYKDVIFTSFVILFTVAIIRKFKLPEINKKLNFFVLILSSFGICLTRNNGLVAFLIVTIVFLVIFPKTKQNMKVTAKALSIWICSCLAFVIAMNCFFVKPADIVESLSIPLQQVASVAKNSDNLRIKQIDLISEVCDINDVKNKFNEDNADGIKNAIRDKNNQDALVNNFPNYIALYFELGFQYPDKFINEWIEMTKGYYNLEISENLLETGVISNNLGLKQNVIAPELNKFLIGSINFLKNYFPFPVCIGIYTWLLFIALYLAICKCDKQVAFCCVPAFAIFITLLLSTPLSCEFRYAYPIICLAPFLFIIAFSSSRPIFSDNTCAKI